MENSDDTGRLERIWVKRARRGIMDQVESAEVQAGLGIEGNANQGGRRQVTVISSERWARVMEELGADVDPKARRANLLVSGVDLEGTSDRVLRIGAIRLEVRGETRPCERMDEACRGLREALSPAWGGGIYGEVLDSGVVKVGDPVRWER